jgi:hypothetical protein
MEPNPSNRDSVARCEMCLERLVVHEYLWKPINPISVTRQLCDECGKLFTSKVNELTSRFIGQMHSRFIEWEQQERVARKLDRRQIRLPFVQPVRQEMK